VVVIGVIVAIGAVVVTTVAVAIVGGGGGGAETTWDSGSEAQPAMRPITLQRERNGAKEFARVAG